MKSSSKNKNATSKKKRKPNFKPGRPKSLDSEQRENLFRVYYSKPVSIRTLAKMFGVSRMTVWREIHGGVEWQVRP
uniref:Resolvase HTH domain-containing protein n=1 Tax=uncultured marine group II/III euryarchaeote KM3_195_B08 TaxID=1457970 RepID=A0A075GWX2_9EURY|nr:hypothetical protein [uncultured marine group II/III euryarchaeote KM3_195_B08]